MSHTLIIKDVWYTIGGYKVIITDRGRIWYAKLYSKKDREGAVPLIMLEAPNRPELIRKIKKFCEKTTDRECRFRFYFPSEKVVDKVERPKKVTPKKIKSKKIKLENTKKIEAKQEPWIYPSDVTELKMIGYASFLMLMGIMAILIF